MSAAGIVAGAAHKFTLGGGGIAVLGGLTANEAAALGGLLVAGAGLLVQVYYKRKDERRKHANERRAEQLHEVRMRAALLRPYEADIDD